MVASGLDNPRGLELAHGKLWVTEAGKGGAGPCVPGPEGTPVCFGLSGALTKVDLWGGGQQRVLIGAAVAGEPGRLVGHGPVGHLGRPQGHVDDDRPRRADGHA